MMMVLVLVWGSGFGLRGDRTRKGGILLLRLGVGALMELMGIDRE
ncbi:hypothetical protein [Microcoleus asticus]|uniref:Uncharacterized protein n=1 Tax=Microcoleus asticus IPMA8 TaxID=2563858 RepID=A0ABX2CZA0_9CYAN|nr:hypothetical protein [Microcoleus asticus]NQE35725.1 hypothetical protein [Microcoleus asticus IPMA8]